MIATYVFDDLYVGLNFIFRRTVSVNDVNAFATLTGDYHPLHVDKEYAIGKGFSDLLAHGFLLTSYLSYAVGMNLPGENAILLSQSSRYLKPVYIGDELTIICTIAKMEKRFSTFTINFVMMNSREEKVVDGIVEVKVRQ